VDLTDSRKHRRYFVAKLLNVLGLFMFERFKPLRESLGKLAFAQLREDGPGNYGPTTTCGNQC
jgi:hypothetical protein